MEAKGWRFDTEGKKHYQVKHIYDEAKLCNIYVHMSHCLNFGAIIFLGFSGNFGWEQFPGSCG